MTSCSSPNSRRFLIPLPSYHLFLLKNNTQDKHAFYFCDWTASKRGSSVLGWPIMREKLRKFYSLNFNWTFCGIHRESHNTLVQRLYRKFVNAKLWSWTELPKLWLPAGRPWMSPLEGLCPLHRWNLRSQQGQTKMVECFPFSCAEYDTNPITVRLQYC